MFTEKNVCTFQTVMVADVVSSEKKKSAFLVPIWWDFTEIYEYTVFFLFIYLK